MLRFRRLYVLSRRLTVEWSLCGPVAYSLYYFLIWVCSNGHFETTKLPHTSTENPFNVAGCAADLKRDVIFFCCSPHTWCTSIIIPIILVFFLNKLDCSLLYSDGWIYFFFYLQIFIMDDKCQRLASKWIIIRIMPAHSSLCLKEISIINTG